MIQAGKYRARASEVQLTTSGQKGTPAVQVMFRITTEGDAYGETIRWDGWCTEKTTERVIEALRNCGWDGDGFEDFADRQLHGLDLNEVEIVVEIEPYNGDKPEHQGKSFPRVAWVNKLGGRGLNLDQAMKPDAVAAFSDRFKGLIAKAKQKSPAVGDGTDFNYGANQKATGTNGPRKF